MHKTISAAMALAAAICVSGQALAQSQPAAPAVPEKMPFDIPYGAPIGYERAQQLLQAAMAEATKRGWKMNIAVVDTHGDLVAFARMDGGLLASISISQGKARTAARYRRETRAFFNAVDTGHPSSLSYDPLPVASPGGIPLIENGKLIGAIGCSSGTGDQDALVCKAGADLVK